MLLWPHPLQHTFGVIESVLLGIHSRIPNVSEGAGTGAWYGAMAAGAVPYITCEACILLTKRTDATTRFTAPAWSLKSKEIEKKKEKREQELCISAKARSTP